MTDWRIELIDLIFDGATKTTTLHDLLRPYAFVANAQPMHQARAISESTECYC